MGLYIYIWILLVVGCFTLSQHDRKFKFFFLKLACIFFGFFIGWRHQIGGDWFTYEIMYNQIASFDWRLALIYTDPSYGITNWLAYQLGLGIHYVNLFIAFIFIYGLFLFCIKLAQPWLSILVSTPYLLIVVAMGYTRQSAAIGITMIGFIFLLKHQPWRYIGFILFAATFHKTAIVMLIFLPLGFPHLNIGRIFFILMFVTGAGLLFIMERLSGMWDLYINQGMESDGGLLRVLLNVLPAMCFLILRKKWQIRWPDSYRFLLWLSVAALLLLPLQFLASTAVDRISLYIIPLQIMVFSNLPLLFSGTVRYLCVIGIVSGYSSIYLIWLNFSYYAECCWIPYNNILFIN